MLGHGGVSEPAPNPDAAPRPSRLKRLILVVGVATVVLAGAGGGLFAWKKSRAAGPAPKPDGPPGVLSLDPFVVNLADGGGSRFLRVSMRLVTGTREEAEHLAKDEVALTRVRSAILELLAQQTAERLVTPEGKAELKRTVAERVAPLLEGAKVNDVLFADFVVQF